MKGIYAWAPWFQELAQKIADGGETYLAERAKRVDWVTDNPALLNYGDENIAPPDIVGCLITAVVPCIVLGIVSTSSARFKHDKRHKNGAGRLA